MADMSTQRLTLTADPEWLQEARDAVDRFVAGLQAGIDSADAQTYNADFADDVMWGSPYGATVFSEMAMYVLVRRDGKWWLAAGQNTPIRPKP